MSDPTRFDLDDRQRAMLAEMGVRVWWPQRSDAEPQVVLGDVAAAAVAASAPAPAPASVVSGAAGVASSVRPAPSAVPVTRPSARGAVAPMPAPVQTQGQVFAPMPEGLSSMGWSELQTAVTSCRSCGLCVERQTPVLGSGLGTARWMVVGDLPLDTDAQLGQSFTGPEGVLLDNMLKAVGVRRQGPVGSANASANASADVPEACLTHAVKCRPLNGRNPETAELAICSGYLSRQVALAQPRVILAMGRFAIQSLLGSSEPMGKLRGRLHDFQGVPVVVTYPPSSLLRNPADKAKAWADLVLALSVAQG